MAAAMYEGDMIEKCVDFLTSSNDTVLQRACLTLARLSAIAHKKNEEGNIIFIASAN